MTLGFNFIGNRLGAWSALAISPIIGLTGRPSKSFLPLVEGPFGLFTTNMCFPEIIHFFLEKLRIVTNSFFHIGEGANDSIQLRDDGSCPTVSFGLCV